MLIENSIYRNSYVANGTSTEFTISFPFLEASHIIVYKNIDGVESVVDAHEYSVAGAGDEHGGTLTFGSAPSNGTVIVIARNVPITQLHKYTELDNFPAKSHEDALAKLTMIDQQQQDSINRAIKLAETDMRTPEELLNEIFTAKDTAVACATESCQCADNADASRGEALQFRNEAETILNNTISEGEKAVANVQAQEASSIQAVKDQEATSVAEVVAEGDTQAVRLVDLANNILVSGTAYNKEVTADVTVDTPANTYITLPVDGKGNQLMYRVGSAMIRMSYNGAQMYVGDQFDEVGIAGSISTRIKVNFDLEVGSRLNFFIMAQNVTVIVDQESGLSIDEQNRLTAKPLKDSTVHTVNGTAPDSNRNIDIDVGVKTVNGTAPDEAGNVVLGTAKGIVPVGSVIAFAANVTPDGYLICNGAAVSRTTYANLYAKIGDTYGAGDGSTTFNLPNLIDRFIHGHGTAGIYVNAGAPNIAGQVRGAFYPSSPTHPFTSGDAYTSANVDSRPADNANDMYPCTIYFNARLSNSVYGNSTTIQPPALTMRYYIKY